MSGKSKETSGSFAFRTKRALLETVERLENLERETRKNWGKERFKEKMLKKQLPEAYLKAAKMPVDEKKIVFIEVRHEKLTNSFQVMFDELANKYDYNIHTHFLMNNKVVREEYLRRCKNAVEDMATAKYVFMNEGSNAISSVPLRPETKVIQLWHGCGAFKKFGLSTADLIFGENREQQLKYPFNKNYSLVTVSSPEVSWAYAEAMNIENPDDVIVATGSSRTDIFYDDSVIEDAKERLLDLMPQAKDKRVILYAPTFRGRVASATTPDMLNVEMFQEYLGDEYVLLFKHHPNVKVRPEIPALCREFAADMTDDMSIEELLCVSDVCISDYSSLVFEYSLFEKPLIFFAYDLDEYFDWRGFYYKYEELAPGPIAKTNLEMIEYIQNIDTAFDKKAIQDFKYKFMRSCDGHATQRIIDHIFENPEAHRVECNDFEHFYSVPGIGNSKKPYFKEIQKMKAKKQEVVALYEEYKNTPVKETGIVAFEIRDPGVKYMLKKYSKDYEIEFLGTKDLKNAIEKIASAKCIIIDRDNTVLNSIELRKETEVILLAPNAFPYKAFGIRTKAYRSGLLREKYEIAPLYNCVTATTAPAKDTARLNESAIGKDVKVYEIGDIRSDLLFDEEFKQKTLSKLYEKYPKFAGRKIISFIPEGMGSINDSYVYEYLYKDYVFLKHFEKKDKNLERLGVQVKEEVNYYGDSIVDVSDDFTVYELMSISDIVIGDFSSELYSFVSTGKPIYRYCEEFKREFRNSESLVEMDEVAVGKFYSSTKELVQAIRNEDGCDKNVCQEMKEKYLKNCDGNSTKRLLEEIVKRG